MLNQVDFEHVLTFFSHLRDVGDRFNAQSPEDVGHGLNDLVVVLRQSWISEKKIEIELQRLKPFSLMLEKCCFT